MIRDFKYQSSSQIQSCYIVFFKCKFKQWVGFFYFIDIIAFHTKGKMSILYEGTIFYEKWNLISMTTIQVMLTWKERWGLMYKPHANKAIIHLKTLGMIRLVFKKADFWSSDFGALSHPGNICHYQNRTTHLFRRCHVKLYSR